MLLLHLPVLAAAITSLLFHRNFGSPFFDPLGGVILYFSAYVSMYCSLSGLFLILPGFVIIGHICLSSSISDNGAGFYGVLFSMFSIVRLGSSVWGYHMFTVWVDIKTAVFFG